MKDDKTWGEEEYEKEQSSSSWVEDEMANEENRSSWGQEELGSEQESEPDSESQASDEQQEPNDWAANERAKEAASAAGNLLKQKIMQFIIAHPWVIFAIGIFLLVIIVIVLLMSTGESGRSLTELYTTNCQAVIIEGMDEGNYELEDWVAGVTAAELAGGGIEARKSVAVTVRTLTINLSNNCTTPINNGSSVANQKQGYLNKDNYTEEEFDRLYALGKEAADATVGEIMVDSNGKAIQAAYSAYPREGYNEMPAYPKCGKITPTKNGITYTTTLYKLPTVKPFEFEMPERNSAGSLWNGLPLINQQGHCYGLNEVGAMYLEETGKTYMQILETFFDFDKKNLLDMLDIGSVGSLDWGPNVQYDCEGVTVSFAADYKGHVAQDLTGRKNGNNRIKVYSIGPGKIVSISKNPSYGNPVTVKTKLSNGNEIYIVYGHFDSINSALTVGMEVKADTWLGIQGNTGNVYCTNSNGDWVRPAPGDKNCGTHVHLETRSPFNFYINRKTPTNFFYQEEMKRIFCDRIVKEVESETQNPNEE